MRYDERVYFVKTSGEVYNPDTGRYEQGPNTAEIRPANITDLGIERSFQAFGDFQSNRMIVRLQRPYTKDFDYMIFRAGKYHVKLHKQKKTVFYVEGDNLH